MNSVVEKVTVNAPAAKVFNAYVNFIDEWWPRQGAKYRYTFAPEGVEPDRIRFEARHGGRFYETFADGSEYEMGRITEWNPNTKLSYTWKAPSWSGDTLIEVSFEERDDRTQVTVVHSGIEAVAEPEVAAGYGEGTTEIYGIFTSWVEENLGKL